MPEPLGDPDLAAMVGLTGGEQITAQQAYEWLNGPSPKANLREQIALAIAAAEAGGPVAQADAVLAKVIRPHLEAEGQRFAELSRDLRDTHQKLIGERRLTAAYSTRFGSLATLETATAEPVRVDRPCDQPPVDPDSLAGRISFALDDKECTHPERIDCVDCMVDAVLSVVSPLLAAKDAENERANSKAGEYCRLYQTASDELAASRSAQKAADQGGES